MKTQIAILWLCAVNVAAMVDDAPTQKSTAGNNIVVVPVLQVPAYLPTCTNAMTVTEAATIHKLSTPVVVMATGAYEDGGTFAVVLTDAKGRHLGFSRSPWAWNDPVYFYIDSLTEANKSVQLQYDSKELKALSVLCLNWADTTFKKDQQRQVFKKEGIHTETENDLLHILYLFRPQVFDEWRDAEEAAQNLKIKKGVQPGDTPNALPRVGGARRSGTTNNAKEDEESRE